MKRVWTIGLVVLLILAAGCTKEEEMVQTELSIGLMPAVDTAPIYLAQDKGYFEEAGLTLNIELFTNAQDRQTALQTETIDGAMTDLVAVATNRAGGFDLAATMLTDGMFVILANDQAVDKQDVKVGMMEVSVSNFLVEEWLSETHKVEKVFVNAIPARLEAVASGGLDMGLFPEPIASVGELKGLTKMRFEPVDGHMPDVMAFTGKAIEEKTQALEAFHRAYNRAVADIRENPELAGETLIEHIPNLKPELKDLMTLPAYEEARLPELSYLEKITDWTNKVVSEPLEIDPAELVDRRFVE